MSSLISTATSPAPQSFTSFRLWSKRQKFSFCLTTTFTLMLPAVMRSQLFFAFPVSQKLHHHGSLNMEKPTSNNPRKLVLEEELPWYWHIHRKSRFNKTFGEFGFWDPCFKGFTMKFSEDITILKSYTFSVAQKPQKQLFQRPTVNCQKWGEKWSHYDVREPWLEQAVHDILSAVNPQNWDEVLQSLAEKETLNILYCRW